ncbi:MAG TPA: hypothetical protein VGJ86_24815, partial [Acidimicrobiales bacterium]
MFTDPDFKENWAAAFEKFKEDPVGFVTGCTETKSASERAGCLTASVLFAVAIKNLSGARTAAPFGTGSLEIIGENFSASELKIAGLLASEGETVVLREQFVGPNLTRLSDLLVNGESVDVYTPKTGNISRIVDSVASKADQVRGGRVIVDLENSPLTTGDIPENFLRRVQNHHPTPTPISNVRFVD